MATTDVDFDSWGSEMRKLKEDLRPYFARIDCSLRVLGSQLGLEPSELTDLERFSLNTSTDLRQLLLDKCFNKEKITSLEQFASVLEKPALNQTGLAKEIRNRLSVGRQISMESATSSIASAASLTSPFLSLTSSMEASTSSTIETVKTGSKGVCTSEWEVATTI